MRYYFCINGGVPGMKKSCFKGRIKGFTLIELLVVVLIIGILAAIALPQYQKAVEKSRIAEAVTVLKSLRQSWQLCVLEHGKSDDSNVHTHPCGINFFKDITIDIPGSKGPAAQCDATDCIVTNDWHYDYDGYYLDAYRIHNADINSTVPYQIEIELPNGQFVCLDNEVAGSCQKICGADGCQVN